MLWKPDRAKDERVISLIELAGTGDYRGRRAMFDLDHLTICRERDMRLGYTIAEQDFEQLVPVYDDVRPAASLPKAIAPVQRGEFSSNKLSPRMEGGTFPRRLT